MSVEEKGLLPGSILPTLPEDEKTNVLQKAGILKGWFSGETQTPPPPLWFTGEHREKTTAAVLRQVIDQTPNVKILGADVRETPPGRVDVDLRQKLATQLGLPAAEQIKVSESQQTKNHLLGQVFGEDSAR